jgi:hypothetical protein
MTLMFAYGSNLNLTQMLRRCPAAKPLGRFDLDDARLVFRGVADVEYAEGESCPGGLWEITRACERELDRYEGVEYGLYRKTYITVKMLKTGKVRRILVYQMNNDGIMPPDRYYLNVVAEGYRDFGLDLGYLQEAVNNSWREKHKNRVLRRRRLRRGNLPFARSIALAKGEVPTVAKLVRPPVA